MTNAEARFSNSLRPRKPEGSLGRTAQDVHLDSHTAPELCSGGDSVALNIISPRSTISWDLGHRQYLFGDNSAINTFNQPRRGTVTQNLTPHDFRAKELCESRGGRPGLSVLTSITVSVDVKQH